MQSTNDALLQMHPAVTGTRLQICAIHSLSNRMGKCNIVQKQNCRTEECDLHKHYHEDKKQARVVRAELMQPVKGIKLLAQRTLCKLQAYMARDSTHSEKLQTNDARKAFYTKP